MVVAATLAQSCAAAVRGCRALPANACRLPCAPACCAAGLQTTGAWLVFSQGFAVAAATRVAARCCRSFLAAPLHQFLLSRSWPLASSWRQAVLDAEPGLLCLGFALGLQVRRVGWMGLATGEGAVTVA